MFQKEVIPFLQQVFMPIVNAIFSALTLPVEENDEQGKREKQLLQRNYFQFIAAIVTNNISEVLNAQDSHFLEQVMMSIIRGAVDFPDPVVSLLKWQCSGHVVWWCVLNLSHSASYLHCSFSLFFLIYQGKLHDNTMKWFIIVPPQSLLVHQALYSENVKFTIKETESCPSLER
jgi:hypothetical protein